MQRAGGVPEVALVLQEDARNVQIYGFHPAVWVVSVVFNRAGREAAPLGEEVVEGDKWEGRLQVVAQVVSYLIIAS